MLMKGVNRIFLALLILVLCAASSPAAIYQWTDRDGTVNFADDLHNVPPEYRSNARKMIEMLPAKTSSLGIAGDEYHIPFEKTPTGVLLVSVVINDSVNARMIFDTGASVVMISEDLWRRIEPEASEEDRNRKKNVKILTAAGTTTGKILTIQKMELGQASRDNVRAVINPDFKRFDGLLGMSFLDDYQITIDYERGKIILKKR